MVVQNPPRDERTLQRRLADLENRIRVLETTSKPFAGEFTSFAAAADRTTVLTSPHEGDLSYQQDTDTYYRYTGSVWVEVASSVAMALATAAGAVWTTWVPTWSGSTTNPVLNNGTMVGRYLQVGKTVSFKINLTMGSTTTYGSGAYGWTLPIAPHSDAAAAAVLVDVSAASRYTAAAWLTAGSGVFRLLSAVATGHAGVAGTVPFTFANTDQIIISGTYETA